MATQLQALEIYGVQRTLGQGLTVFYASVHVKNKPAYSPREQLVRVLSVQSPVACKAPEGSRLNPKFFETKRLRRKLLLRSHVAVESEIQSQPPLVPIPQLDFILGIRHEVTSDGTDAKEIDLLGAGHELASATTDSGVNISAGYTPQKRYNLAPALLVVLCALSYVHLVVARELWIAWWSDPFKAEKQLARVLSFQSYRGKALNDSNAELTVANDGLLQTTEEQAKETEPPAELVLALKNLVKDFRISGVLAGPRAGALINGRLVRLGDKIPGDHYIRLVAVETEPRVLIIEGEMGAKVRVRY